jgi:outer membrane protein
MRPIWVSILICVILVTSRPSGAADVPITAGATLPLDRAIALALQYEPARLAAEADAGAANERVGEARSELLPHVLGTAQYLRGTDNGIGDTAYLSAPGVPRAPTSGRYVNQLTKTFDNYLGAVSAYQYLFDFGRTRGLVEQRDAEADAARARLDVVRLDLVFQVSKAYFDLLAAREIVKVFEEALTQRTEHLHSAEVKGRAGLEPEIDAYTARAELARTQLRLTDARNAAATAKAALDNTMGLGPGTPEYRLPPLTTRGQRVSGSLDEYLDRALRQRPDLKMLEDEARAAGAEILEYKSDYFPAVAAVAGVNTRGQNATPGTNYTAGLVITWPIFDGFLTDHQVAEARLHEESVRHSIEELRQQVALEVQRAFLDWQASVERIRHAEQTLDASRAQLELATKRYESGLGSIIELTDAQRRFTEDGAEEAEAHAAFEIAKAALDRDVGVPPPQG